MDEFRVKIGNVRWHNDPPEVIEDEFGRVHYEDDRDVVASHRYSASDRFYLLDKLNEFNRLWSHMRKHDLDSYKMFSRMGSRVLSREALLKLKGNIFDHIDWKDLPGFGSYICLPDHDWEERDDDKVFPSVYYFHRLKRSPTYVQKTIGAVYSCGLLYHDKKQDRSIVQHFYVALYRDGKVKFLKQKGYWNRWFYPPFAEEAYPNGKDPSPMFNMMLSACLFASGGVQVRCRRGASTAVIAMNMNDAKKVFPAKERDAELASDGKRKRIWHWNKGWTDRLGRVVPGHFKGDRNFYWKGWSINIRHDAKWKDTLENAYGLDGSIELEDEQEPEDFLEGKVVGNMIDRAVKSKSTKQINKALKLLGVGDAGERSDD